MKADVVIVGAGVMGASAAWHLAALGVKSIVLLEREAAPGLGSTGRATGGFRAQHGTAINVRLSLLAREKLRRFRDELGVDPGYLPAGYLWLASSEGQLAELREAQALQHAEGLHEARMLSPAEASALNPAVRMDGMAGAAFCPTDGFLRPLEILRGYLQGAQRLGALLVHSAAPLSFGLRGGRIESVRTVRDNIEAGCVIDAAGPWAAEVARLAGIELPVVPLRRQLACTVPCALLPGQMPMTIWAEDGFHLRVRDDRVLLLRPSPGNPSDPFDTSVDADWLASIAATTAERVPALAQVPLDRARSWAGLYEMSPDKHALLGRAPGCDNLFLINGSSGHGVMHAPALGQLLAEIIVHGAARALDVHALRPSRFAEGAPIAGPSLL